MTQPTMSLPEFSISPSMRSAASAVAACFHAYQQSCFDLPATKGVANIQALLRAQRERKQAYHLALKFLETASLKENPAYDLSARDGLSESQIQELTPLITHYLDSRLNQLIQSEVAANPLITNTHSDHPILRGLA